MLNKTIYLIIFQNSRINGTRYLQYTHTVTPAPPPEPDRRAEGDHQNSECERARITNELFLLTKELYGNISAGAVSSLSSSLSSSHRVISESLQLPLRKQAVNLHIARVIIVQPAINSAPRAITTQVYTVTGVFRLLRSCYIYTVTVVTAVLYRFPIRSSGFTSSWSGSRQFCRVIKLAEENSETRPTRVFACVHFFICSARLVRPCRYFSFLFCSAAFVLRAGGHTGTARRFWSK